jgi:hypothetical protein
MNEFNGLLTGEDSERGILTGEGGGSTAEATQGAGTWVCE